MSTTGTGLATYLGVLAGLVVWSACTSSGSGAAENAATPFSCGRDYAPVTRSDSSLTTEAACGLVRSAVEAFRTSPPPPLGQEADTAQIAEVRISSQTIREWESDSVVGNWWIVTLDLPGQQFNVDVRLEKTTRAPELQTVHKEIG